MKKSILSLTGVLRYCKDIANLLFWKLWECLTIPIKIIVSICSKLSCLSPCKINMIMHFFLKILQRNSKLVILGNLDVPGHTPESINLNCQFVIYFQAKNQPHPSSFPWNIAKILYTCIGYFGHTWQRTTKRILSTCRKGSCLSAAKKNNFISHTFLQILQK